MKLIDLLVKELPKLGGWPRKVTSIGQDYDRELMFYGIGNPRTGIILDELAVDYRKSGVSDKGVTKYQYESALDKNDGWIEWGGGECPVEPSKHVDVRFRDGDDDRNIEAIDLLWNHENWSADIITYRLHKPGINSRANDDRLEQDLNECIGQEVAHEWRGEGLPPVGTICEAKVPRSITGWEWRKVKVVESGIPGAEKEVLVYDLETTLPTWTDEFRPLRTEAERKRDDAKKAISELRDRDGYKLAACMIDPIYEAIAEGKIPGVKLENK